MKHHAGIYQVVGRLPFRGHKPGDRFTAKLDPKAERRAVDRGNIVLLERVIPSIQQRTFTLPTGWAQQHEEE
jgi:hypothetical protein